MWCVIKEELCSLLVAPSSAGSQSTAGCCWLLTDSPRLFTLSGLVSASGLASGLHTWPFCNQL